MDGRKRMIDDGNIFSPEGDPRATPEGTPSGNNPNLIVTKPTFEIPMK
jgi:hypothetical protein